jgi:Domain of unknown function (DUF6457)
MLERWLQTAAEAAGTTDADSTLLGAEAVTAVLDLARDAAHGVARPAAPLATFVAGLAVGRSGGGLSELQAIVGRLAEAADAWESDAGEG